MPDINFMELVNISAAPLTLSFGSSPEGLSTDRAHVSPKNAIRTADGGLITQTVPYTKKDFEIQGTFWDRAVHTYLQALMEGNDPATLTLFYKDANFVDQTEFTGSVMLTAYQDARDFVGNNWSFTATFMEV